MALVASISLSTHFPSSLLQSLFLSTEDIVDFFDLAFKQSQICDLSCPFSRAPENPICGDTCFRRIDHPHSRSRAALHLRMRSYSVCSMQKIKITSMIPPFPPPPAAILLRHQLAPVLQMTNRPARGGQACQTQIFPHQTICILKWLQHWFCPHSSPSTPSSSSPSRSSANLTSSPPRPSPHYHWPHPQT